MMDGTISRMLYCPGKPSKALPIVQEDGRLSLRCLEKQLITDIDTVNGCRGTVRVSDLLWELYRAAIEGVEGLGWPTACQGLRIAGSAISRPEILRERVACRVMPETFVHVPRCLSFAVVLRMQPSSQAFSLLTTDKAESRTGAMASETRYFSARYRGFWNYLIQELRDQILPHFFWNAQKSPHSKCLPSLRPGLFSQASMYRMAIQIVSCNPSISGMSFHPGACHQTLLQCQQAA